MFVFHVCFGSVRRVSQSPKVKNQEPFPRKVSPSSKVTPNKT
jgi:hypothetical protein